MLHSVPRFFGRHPSVPVFLGGFLLFSLGAVGTEITRIDVRFALMVQEMAVEPIGLFPTINGMAYADYFSPYVFLSYLTTLGGRWVNLWSLALPTLLLSSYIAAMTFAIGERERKGMGFVAACFYFFSYEMLQVTMSFGIDVPVAAATVTVMWLLQNHLTDWKGRIGFALLLWFALAMRGPMGLILCGASAGGWLLSTRRWREVLLYGGIGAGAAALGAAAVAGIIYAQGGEALWTHFREWQIDSRFGWNEPWFYFVNAILSYSPAAILAVIAVIQNRRYVKEQPLAGWLAWALMPMILLSFPRSQHLRYVALCIPAYALIAAYGYCNWNRLRRGDWLPAVLRKIDPLLPYLGVAAFAGLAVGGGFVTKAPTPFFQFILGAFLCILFCRASRPWRESPGPLFRATAVFATVIVLGAGPFDAMRESSRSFVKTVETVRGEHLYLYQVGPDHDDLKYILHTPIADRSAIRYLLKPRWPVTALRRMYPSRPSEEAALTPPDAVLVLQRKDLDNLRKHLLPYNLEPKVFHSGEIGHKKYVAVTLIPFAPPIPASSELEPTSPTDPLQPALTVPETPAAP